MDVVGVVRIVGYVVIVNSHDVGRGGETNLVSETDVIHFHGAVSPLSFRRAHKDDVCARSPVDLENTRDKVTLCKEYITGCPLKFYIFSQI